MNLMHVGVKGMQVCLFYTVLHKASFDLAVPAVTQWRTVFLFK